MDLIVEISKGGATDFGGLYYGEHLAALGDVVVVTHNYRLGPFGYLAHPALSKESGTESSGNWGIMDSIAVLKWVQKNIRHFKGIIIEISLKIHVDLGDPNNVTYFGVSAGAYHLLAMVVSPQANGLFHKVPIFPL